MLKVIIYLWGCSKYTSLAAICFSYIINKITWKQPTVTICSKNFQLFFVWNISLIPIIYSITKQLENTFTYQNWFPLNNFGVLFRQFDCLMKPDLNMNLATLQYIAHRPFVFLLLNKVKNFGWFIWL